MCVTQGDAGFTGNPLLAAARAGRPAAAAMAGESSSSEDDFEAPQPSARVQHATAAAVSAVPAPAVAATSLAALAEELRETRRRAEAKDLLLNHAWETQRRLEAELGGVRGENEVLRARVGALEQELAARDAELLLGGAARATGTIGTGGGAAAVAVAANTVAPSSAMLPGAAAGAAAGDASDALARWGLDGDVRVVQTEGKQSIERRRRTPAAVPPAEAPAGEDEVAAAAAAAVAELVRDQAAQGLSSFAGGGGDVDAFVARVQEHIASPPTAHKGDSETPVAPAGALASLAALGARMVPVRGSPARLPPPATSSGGSNDAAQSLRAADEELSAARGLVSAAVDVLRSGA